MKFPKVGFIVAGILLGNSGLISCVSDSPTRVSAQPPSDDRMETTYADCIDPNLEELNSTPSSTPRKPKAPSIGEVQESADCIDPNLQELN